MQPCVLIPAFQPDKKLVNLVRDLHAAGLEKIVVVDDGGGSESAALFAEIRTLNVPVVTHVVNQGKGRALKTGLNYILEHGLGDWGVITADADGQHKPDDIEKIARAMTLDPDALVLGVREFKGDVPLRSKFGNRMTRLIFTAINGADIRDTQTGLRGLPARHLRLFLQLKGEQYEYEMNQLLAIRTHEIKVSQVQIATVYIEANQSSHFNPVLDSLKIYGLLLRFMASSSTAGLIDLGIFYGLSHLLPGYLLATVVAARIVSSLVNYFLNHTLVFARGSRHRQSLARYYVLATIIMLLSYSLIRLFNQVLGWPLLLAKISGDGLLYVLSFYMQREFVYRTPRH
ncbi:MAG: bifunctional glycosyltransferase family 2/GtrA family protein [Eubacteriales bacterium]|nr:bifunctional glycosyltransferase family 2/GtrA family protein [Eubacteriales bacterium]